MYIIKCFNEGEEFYKIGKTFKDVEARFKNKEKMPYMWEIIKVIHGNALQISELENKLQQLNKEFKYIPKIDFGGKYECFSKVEHIV